MNGPGSLVRSTKSLASSQTLGVLLRASAMDNHYPHLAMLTLCEAIISVCVGRKCLLQCVSNEYLRLAGFWDEFSESKELVWHPVVAA